MDEAKDFDFINSTYWKMFSYSHLNVFLDEHPSRDVSYWKLKRYVTYFFLFLYFPVWLVIEVSGMFLGRKGDLAQVAFDLSYVAHIVQLVIKMGYFLYHIKDIRSLCLRFERFHTSNHRPVFSRRLLGERGQFLRRLASTYYTVIYMNFLFWIITPLFIQPIIYGLTQAGFITATGPQNIIPKFFPVRYPFDETSTRNRIIIACMEFTVLSAGFTYFIPIDQFFVSVIVMVCSEIDVICKSLMASNELARELDRDYSLLLGSEDNRNRIDLKLFIEDHQRALRTTKKISEVMNPILGLVVGNCMVLLCTLALVITTKMKTASSFSEVFREVFGFIVVMTTSLITLYLYSWMCGELKSSEEAVFGAVYSSDWYNRNKSYRDNVLIVMRQSYTSRPLRMMSMGDMDKETFIKGLKGIYTYYNFLTHFE
ncbi:unnamed protein product [Nezara viridula]|uniref:Odorant receptor n=1 Tax=Nezara viridula TaxID=85310 RepID=A0A9P0MQX1_NEZVI|nr:unnamed protein product [Nezara viridula]